MNERELLEGMEKSFQRQQFLSENQRFVTVVRRAIDAVIAERFGSDRPAKFSERISEETGQDYDLVSALYFQIQDVEIEEYIESRKVEKAKEALVYTDCLLPEIARLLDFETVTRFCQAMSKHTGHTIDYFTNVRREKLEIMHRAEKSGIKKAASVQTRLSADK